MCRCRKSMPTRWDFMTMCMNAAAAWSNFGGVTFGGGEPSLQAEELCDLLIIRTSIGTVVRRTGVLPLRRHDRLDELDGVGVLWINAKLVVHRVATLLLLTSHHPSDIILRESLLAIAIIAVACIRSILATVIRVLLLRALALIAIVLLGILACAIIAKLSVILDILIVSVLILIGVVLVHSHLQYLSSMYLMVATLDPRFHSRSEPR